MVVRSKLFLIRHGETDANRNGIIQGQLDTPLNEHGRRQAQQVADALQSVSFDKAYSSDLQRAADTAAAIVTHHPHLCKDMQQTAALRERLMGDLQGKHISEFSIRGHSETPSAFASRATSWWNEVVSDLVVEAEAKESGPVLVLVVTHGGFINTLLHELMRKGKLSFGKDVSFGRCHNCSVTVIEVYHNRKGVVIRYGDISHLRDEEMVADNADEVAVDP